jgi:uncharacterized membrane protein
VTPPRVWALAAQTTSGYRRAWARERLRDSFWPIPGLLLVAAVALAALTANAGSLGIPAGLRAGPRVDPGETSSVLGIIATSTLTFLGVVFTLTLVALQLASSQLSPRVVRMFVRSGVTKLAFGILLAAFSYSVAFLALEGGHHAADSSGLAVAMALVTASLIVFLGYVATTMRLLQVAWVITRVADETRVAIGRSIPAAGSYLQASPPRLAADPVRVALAEDSRKSLGVLQGVDHRRLLRLARRYDCVLQLLVRIGEYIPTGGVVIAVHASGAPQSGAPPRDGVPPYRAILSGLSLGRTRTVYQDPSFGLRQLVDIAIQALSPAVNQPTTAVQVIDRMEGLLLRIGHRADRTGYYADEAGQVRFVEPVLAWDDLLDLAFSEITAFGAASVQVSRRLLAAYDALLQESADRGGSQAGLQPDALGLG